MLEDKDLKSIQEVRSKVEQAYQASLEFRKFTQEQVDRIIDHVAAVARAHAEPLARMAVEETGYGNVRDKIAKNLLNSDTLHQAIRPLKTAGIVNEDPARGVIEIAEPVGVVAAILPTTNPTSTAFYKTLISLKGRNAVVISPHPRAVRCTCESARILADAAREAGAPEGVIQCVQDATIQGTNELMRHKRTGVILSTGGAGIVRAAYSSGKPALGVGPGNVAVLLDTTADVERAVASVVTGKSFDFGTVCSSEQTVVAERSLRDRVLELLRANGAYLCDRQQAVALQKLLIIEGARINPDCVGQSPQKIAQMAGFSVPDDVRILVVELEGVGRQYPMSAEKLSPVLSVYFVNSFQEAMDACETVLNFGGRGHTCVIYSTDDARIREYGLRMPAFRVLVNTPAPQGSTGITTNVFPSMTLGCGAMAGNVTSDNIGPMHLINIKRVAYHVREAEQAFQSPEAKAYFSGQTAQQPVAAGAGAGSRPGGGSDIAAAVGRYLAQRGLRGAPGGAAAPSPPRPVQSSVRSSAMGRPAAAVVDQFIAARRAQNAQQQSAPSAQAQRPASPAPAAAPAPASSASAAPANPPPTSAPAPKPAPAASPAPPAPEVQVVPFVSEDEVRRAMVKGKKIYIDKNTIVTPAAWDLDSQGGVIVKTD